MHFGALFWSLLEEVEAVCVHYSTNIEAIHPQFTSDGALAQNGWRLVWWDRQLAWDAEHARFLKEQAELSSDFQVVGPVSFTSSRLYPLSRRRPCVAVFDVIPMAEHRLATWSGESYYSMTTVSRFLHDLFEVTRDLDYEILWKSKREVSGSHDGSYVELIDMYKEKDGIDVVPDDTSVKSLVEHSVAAPSIPFTSTALVANFMGKPSAFFDPKASVPQDHPAARGLPVLGSKSELAQWLGHPHLFIR